VIDIFLLLVAFAYSLLTTQSYPSVNLDKRRGFSLSLSERYTAFSDPIGNWMVWDTELEMPAVCCEVTLAGLSKKEAHSMALLLNAQWQSEEKLRRAS
jgi:hypothetical protein